MKNERIVVCGGALAGMASALGLRKAGFDVSILSPAYKSMQLEAGQYHPRVYAVSVASQRFLAQLGALLALCRQEEPEVDIRLFQVPLSQQIKGLQDDLYDVGFAQSDEVGEGIAAEAVWNDPLMVAVPARHHLLKHRRIPLDEVLHFPLVLCDPQACEGYARQVERVLRRSDREPLIVERVASFDLMMVVVSAGFALGLAGAPHIVSNREPGVVARPLAGRSPMLTTYLLRREDERSEVLSRFIERVQAIDLPEGVRPVPPPQSESQEEFEL